MQRRVLFLSVIILVTYPDAHEIRAEVSVSTLPASNGVPALPPGVHGVAANTGGRQGTTSRATNNASGTNSGRSHSGFLARLLAIARRNRNVQPLPSLPGEGKPTSRLGRLGFQALAYVFSRGAARGIAAVPW